LKWEGEALNNPYSAPDAQMSEFNPDDETYQPKIFSLEGRIGRIRYIGYTWLALFIVSFIYGIVAALLFPRTGASSASFGVSMSFYGIWAVVGIIMARRRLHDLDQSGKLAFICQIPIIKVFFGLYLLFAPGTDGSNNYGPKPNKSSLVWLVVLLIPLIGILAAVAIPAYQQYLNKAKAERLQQQQTPQDQQSQTSQQ
jgi:uncharacterized membrane protein YhaH (DUF805 family)